MIICTGRFRQRFASAVGNRALNPGPDAYLPLSYHEYCFHELILNSSINGLEISLISRKNIFEVYINSDRSILKTNRDKFS